MRLLSKLAKAFQRDPTSQGIESRELAAINRDSRLHARYMIAVENLAFLHFPDRTIGAIRDVSYGGMAVKIPLPATNSLQVQDKLKAKLQVLDRSIECSLALVRSVAQADVGILFAGFSIHHDSADTLIFMRDLIEPLRCGKSLVLIDQSVRHERYQGHEWLCFRGDGPTDLIVRLGKDGATLLEALLTFRISDCYSELSLKQNTLRTGRMRGEGEKKLAVGSQMASTAEIDLEVLRQAICILLGMPSEFRHISCQLLSEALKYLNIEMSFNAA